MLFSDAGKVVRFNMKNQRDSERGKKKASKLMLKRGEESY